MVRRRVAMRWLIAAGATLAAAAGCSLLHPLGEFESGRVRPGGDASDGAADAFDGHFCEPVHPPRRPAQGADPAGDLSLVFALQTFEFSAGAADGGALPFAYDLDDFCTCPGPDSCRRPQGTKPACDVEGGIDNAGGEVLQTIARVSSTPLDANDRIAEGRYGLLFRVKGYNGTPNDAQVVVETFLSFGAEGVEDGGTPPRPRWDGNDRWTVDPDAVVGTDPDKYISQYFDTDAYVADDVVVARLDNAPLRLGQLTQRVRGGWLVAKLAREGAVVRVVDGRLYGRFRATDFLTSLDVVGDSTSDGGGVCGDASTIYQVVAPLVCGAVDLVQDPLLDGKDRPCDALAFTARFTARPALLGNVYGAPVAPRLCGPGWSATCP